MKHSWRKLSRLLVAGALAGGVGFGVAGPIPAAAHEGGAHSCSGTFTSPGVLAGRFESVVVKGVCAVNGGAAIVEGDLTVARGGLILAAFALNDVAGHGQSHLSVGRNLIVNDGGTAILGCEPGFFTCLDDPNKTSPTLFSHDRVGRDVIGDEPLGILIHSSTIEGNVNEHGGGGGINCTPTGVFKMFPPAGSPVFSDYEDNRIGGDISVTGLSSCWLGLARDHVGGSMRLVNDQLADPDAIEILANHVEDNLACRGNSMVWDSAEAFGGPVFPRTAEPNTVHGDRFGQCVLSSPTSQGGPLGPGPF